MSAKVTIWAWKQAARLGPKEGPLLLTFLALADMARETGKVWASHRYLADKAHQSPRTIRANIEVLEARGFLRTEPTPGRPDVIWISLTAITLFENGGETDEPGALEKGPRRPRQEMPTSGSAPRAEGVGAKSGETPAGGADKPRTEARKRTQGEANASVGRADDVRQAFEAYNRVAERIGASRAERLNDDRRRRLKARIKDVGGLEEWYAALRRIEGSPFLTGQTHHHFGLTLDFILQPSSFTKLIEGQYEDRPNGGSPASRITTGPDFAAERADARVQAMVDGARQALTGGRRRWTLG